jgi:YesN/AraC family two-component response regulator
MLVDDEPWSLVTLENSMDFARHGFEIKYKLTNPMDALNILGREDMDLVFTDIKMPNITGLEFVETARKNGTNAEFVIVSGYSEFDYALAAIKAKVVDYLLKPVDPSLSDKLLSRLYNIISEKKLSGDIELFSAMLKNELSPEELFNIKKTSLRNRYVFSFIIQGAREGMNIFSEVPHISLSLGSSKKLYIVNPIDDEQYRRLCENRPLDAVCSCSRLYDSMEKINRTVFEAENAGFNIMTMDKKQLYMYKSVDYDFANAFLSKLYNAIDLFKSVDIDELFSSLSGSAISALELTYIWNQIISFISSRYPDAKELYEFYFLKSEDLYFRFKTMHNTISYLEESINNIIADQSTGTDGPSNNENFNELIQYVQKNYDKGLYLKELSRTFYINFTYCCDLFKKNMGCTFTQYVTGLRMKKAAELLVNTSLSIDDIAVKTGYNDYFYFNNVFKKHYNTTPAKYRKSNSH